MLPRRDWLATPEDRLGYPQGRVGYDELYSIAPRRWRMACPDSVFFKVLGFLIKKKRLIKKTYFFSLIVFENFCYLTYRFGLLGYLEIPA